MVAVLRNGTDETSNRRLRFEQAIAACAHSLLSTDDSAALELAARALLSATDAHYLFIDRNIDDPDIGFAASNVVIVSADGSDGVGLDGWRRVPWSTMPAARRALSAGDAFSYKVEALDGSERDQHFDGFSDEVLKIPILIKGVWIGHMGIAANRGVSWTEDEVSLLRAAAQMVGAFWERVSTQEQLETALSASNRQLRFQRALAICARELLIESDERALERAIEAMRDASGSWFGFLDVVEHDPDAGPTLVKKLTTVAPGIDVSDEDFSYWARVPLARMPAAWAELREGRSYAHDLGSSADSDRLLYEESPVPPQSSLKLPILLDGELVGVIGFAHGDGQQAWTADELELLQAGARMIAAHWEREAAHARLRELIESKDEFIAGVSHELRTPLTAVVGLALELRDGREGFSDDEIGEFVSLIAQQGSDVAYIVEDLLVAARVDIDMVTVVAKPVQLGDVLASALSGLSHLSTSHVAVVGTTALVEADAARLRQIMRNLISNSLRYGGPQIEVALSETADRGVVEVRDNGPGIPEQHQSAVFDAYHRAHDPKGQPASVGLGLTVSRQLARLMGGELDYRLEDGWSVFSLTLPLSTQEPA